MISHPVPSAFRQVIRPGGREELFRVLRNGDGRLPRTTRRTLQSSSNFPTDSKNQEVEKLSDCFNNSDKPPGLAHAARGGAPMSVRPLLSLLNNVDPMSLSHSWPPTLACFPIRSPAQMPPNTVSPLRRKTAIFLRITSSFSRNTSAESEKPVNPGSLRARIHSARSHSPFPSITSITFRPVSVVR